MTTLPVHDGIVESPLPALGRGVPYYRVWVNVLEKYRNPACFTLNNGYNTQSNQRTLI